MARSHCMFGTVAALAASGVLLAQGAGCAAQSRACATSAACVDGNVCVVGLCRPAKRAPTRQSAQRVVLEPSSVAIVTAAGAERAGPATVAFGKEELGELVLLLRFPVPFTDSTQILSAYVVMDPAPGAIPGPAPVELRIARILEPWSSHDATWATLPRLSSVESTFLASTWGARPLRLDVTQQVRRWREHRRGDHGLAVLAAPQNPVGAVYSLGLAGGNGPRLDVYLR